MKFSKPLFITVALLIALVIIVPAALVIPFAKAKVEEKAASKTPPAIESIPAPGKWIQRFKLLYIARNRKR